MFITTPQPFLAAAATFPAKTSVVHMGFDDPPIINPKPLRKILGCRGLV